MSVAPPVAPATSARPGVFKRVVRAFVAAVTSPTAVTKEKNLAVFVGVRVALSLGASAALVDAIVKILGA